MANKAPVEDNASKYFKVEVIAQLFGISVRRVQQLTQEGIISTVDVKQKNGRTVKRYDLAPTVKRYVKHLSDIAYGRKQKNQSLEDQKLEKDIEIKDAKAEKLKMEVSELRGEMHRSEDVEEAFEDFAGTVRAAFLQLPGRLAVDTANAQTAMETSALIQEVVNDTLNTLSVYRHDPEFYKKKVREREGWRDREEEDEPEEQEQT